MAKDTGFYRDRKNSNKLRDLSSSTSALSLDLFGSYRDKVCDLSNMVKDAGFYRGRRNSNKLSGS
jgi:hypothetical protein